MTLKFCTPCGHDGNRGKDLFRRFTAPWLRSRRGNIAIMTALLAPVIIGFFGAGAETGYWYVTQQSMQIAADKAAVAAATNASSSYAAEAQAVAAKMGFTNGQNNVTVSASNSATCPSGGTNCYSVSISNKVPLYLAQLVGYSGDTTLDGHKAVNLSATAIAKQGYDSAAVLHPGIGHFGHWNPGKRRSKCRSGWLQHYVGLQRNV